MRDPVVLCSLITNKDKSFLDVDHQILGCALKVTKVQLVCDRNQVAVFGTESFSLKPRSTFCIGNGPDTFFSETFFFLKCFPAPLRDIGF